MVFASELRQDTLLLLLTLQYCKPQRRLAQRQDRRRLGKVYKLLVLLDYRSNE